MREFFHSVTLDEDKCKGCTNCIKRCPTEAIRVRDGKARIRTERCIDCGECIRVCPHHAKRAVSDSLELMEQFRYKIALPAPSLYGQFNNLSEIDYVLTGLQDMGFDDVFEVSRAAEVISDATRHMMRAGGLKMPVISSACPAVVRMIRMRFPSLCDQVLPLAAPMHEAARCAKLEAAARTGLPAGQIGAFFITPCPAKVTDVLSPIGIGSSHVDGTFAMADVYPRLLERMNKIASPRQLAKSGIIGVSWANSGGEASALIQEKYLAADGIENVITVLEELEDERLQGLEFIELNACHGGCVGGVLTVENPYVAKSRIQLLRKYLPVSLNRIADGILLEDLMWKDKLEYRDVAHLSDDITEAIEMLEAINTLEKAFPGLDCGSCGAPSCRALAEDIVTGSARRNDCIFILRNEASVAGVDISPDLFWKMG